VPLYRGKCPLRKPIPSRRRRACAIPICSRYAHPRCHARLGTRLLGVALGYLGARVVLVNSALSLLPWGLAALAFGVVIRGRALALTAAATFGFSVSLAFMLFGYEGTYSTASRTLPFSVLGLFGAFCAMCLALGGHLVAHRRRAEPSRSTE